MSLYAFYNPMTLYNHPWPMVRKPYSAVRVVYISHISLPTWFNDSDGTVFTLAGSGSVLCSAAVGGVMVQTGHVEPTHQGAHIVRYLVYSKTKKGIKIIASPQY